MPDNWVDKRRSFSFRGIGWRLLGFTVRLAIACIGLGIFGTLFQPGKLVRSVVIILIVGVFVVLANNLNDFIRAKLSSERKSTDAAVFTLISGAIEQIRDDQSRNKSNIERQLTNIESVTKLVMGADGHGSEVSANLMLRKHSPDRLHLTRWGTRLEGREVIELLVDKNNLLPGAPTACYKDKSFIYLIPRLRSTQIIFEAKPIGQLFLSLSSSHCQSVWYRG